MPRSPYRRGFVAMTAMVALSLALAGCSGPQAQQPPGADPGTAGSTLGLEDGFIPEPEGISPFDVEHPALSQLDPELLAAVTAAATDAIADGVDFIVTNGWRSARYQQQLLDEAIAEYGSAEEASNFVSTPETSAHVTGHAVDIGRTDANSWLSQHGADYGLCQTFSNEMWHFELGVEPGGVCPAPLASPAER